MNEYEAFKTILGRLQTDRKEDQTYLAFYYAGKRAGVREARMEGQTTLDKIIEGISKLKGEEWESL